MRARRRLGLLTGKTCTFSARQSPLRDDDDDDDDDMLREAWRWIASRLFAALPHAPVAVTMTNSARGVEIAWTRAGRAGTYNVEREEHAVSVRCVDRVVLDALGEDEDAWMDVYLGADDSFVLDGIGEGVTLEARVRAENARGVSAWVYAPTPLRTTKKIVEITDDTANAEWGSQWGRKN